MFTDQEKDDTLRKMLEDTSHQMEIERGNPRKSALFQFLKSEGHVLQLPDYFLGIKFQLSPKGFAFITSGGYAEMADAKLKERKVKKWSVLHTYLSQAISAIIGAAVGAIITWLIMRN